jgi:hypothetical protein
MKRAVLLSVALPLLAACSNPPFIELPNPLPGQITEVGEDTFIVTTSTGGRFEFINANAQDEAMGQGHMRLHLADRTPVLVSWRRDGYRLVAVRVTDGEVGENSTPFPGSPLPARTPFGTP